VSESAKLQPEGATHADVSVDDAYTPNTSPQPSPPVVGVDSIQPADALQAMERTPSAVALRNNEAASDPAGVPVPAQPHVERELGVAAPLKPEENRSASVQRDGGAAPNDVPTGTITAPPSLESRAVDSAPTEKPEKTTQLQTTRKSSAAVTSGDLDRHRQIAGKARRGARGIAHSNSAKAIHNTAETRAFDSFPQAKADGEAFSAATEGAGWGRPSGDYDGGCWRWWGGQRVWAC
jgi:hypothetical protein